MTSVDAPGAPTSWTLPRMPDDDVGAIRALVAAYRQLADELRTAGQQAQAAMSALPGAWTGDAASAASHPAGVLASDVDLVCRGLLDCADDLSRHADAVQRAHEKHRWSWRKLAAAGAVFVVSATAVVVTAGTATPGVAAVDTALLSGEVATAELAVGEATAARAGMTTALQASGRLFSAVRGMGAFVRPQLPYAVGFTGVEATWQVSHDGLNPKALAASFGMNLVLPGAMASTRTAVRALPFLVERPAAGVVTSHVAAGGVVTVFSGTRQEVLTGRVETGQALRAGVSGSALSAAGDVVQRLPQNWRPGALPGIVPGRAGQTASGVPRQNLDEAMRDGLNLDAHEGPALGHAVLKHVGKPVSFLQQRLATESGDMKSTFVDRPTAERAITETLRAHREEVLGFESGQLKSVPPLRVTFDEPVGRILKRNGTLISGHSCRVVLGRDAGGGYVLTAYVAP